MNDAYVQGFIDKCAEHGVDPVKLAQWAAPQELPGGGMIQLPKVKPVPKVQPMSTNTLIQATAPARPSVPPVPQPETNTVLGGMSGPAPTSIQKVQPVAVQKPVVKSLDKEMAAWKSNPANKQVGLERQRVAATSPGG